MSDSPEKTRPVPAVPSPGEPAGRRVPSLFVGGEAGQRVSVIAPEGPALDAAEAARIRERRRRFQEVERLRQEAEIADGIRRIRNTVVFSVLFLAGAVGVWWLNEQWHGQWPIFFTWLVMAAVMLVGFGWILWYTANGD